MFRSNSPQPSSRLSLSERPGRDTSHRVGNRWRWLATVAVATACLAAAPPLSRSAPRLVNEVPADRMLEPPVEIDPGPSEFASIHEGGLAALELGAPFLLPTADGHGAFLRLVARGVQGTGHRTYTFAGDPELGTPASAVASLAARDGLVGGIVRAGDGITLALAPLEPGLQEVRAIAGEHEKQCGGVAEPPAGGAGPDEGGLAEACGDSPLFQDVLVVYTAAAAAAAGGSEAIEKQIVASISLTNLSLKNSRLENRLRLVAAEEVDFPASGNPAADLAAMAFEPAGADIRARREAYGADLVQLVSVITVPGVGGIAYLFEDRADRAYSLVDPDGGLFTPAHEWGHNFGCCHALGDGGGCGVGGYYPFSNGWRFQAGGGTKATIMAYTPDGAERIPHFSNPYVRYFGEPTGSTAPPGANNARTIGLTSLSISNFRCSLVGAPDCNGNGVPDPVDLIDGTSADCNLNGVPDECESGLECPPDELKLFPVDGDPRILDAFGTSISIGQRRTQADPSPYLVVGAYGDDVDAGNSGAAFVWRRSGAAWVQEAKLKAPVPTPNAAFGWSVSAFRRESQPQPSLPERSFIAAGAYRHAEGTQPASGAVFLFARNANTPIGQWPLARTVRRANAPAGELFGYSVALTRINIDAAETLVVGAPKVSGTGRVFVYRVLTDDNLALPGPRTLAFPNATANTDFGWSVAIDPLVPDPNTPADPALRRAIIAAGAPGYSNGIGRVRLFERNLGATSIFPASGTTIAPPGSDASAGMRFGEAVAISDNLVAVGAPGRNGGRGSVYVFRRTGFTSSVGVWLFAQKLEIGSSAVEGDRFGASVALETEPDGTVTLVVGAPRRDVSTALGVQADAGSIFVYRRLPSATSFTLVGERAAFDARRGDEFGFSLLARPGEAWIGAPFNDDQGLNAGSIYFLAEPAGP